MRTAKRASTPSQPTDDVKEAKPNLVKSFGKKKNYTE